MTRRKWSKGKRIDRKERGDEGSDEEITSFIPVDFWTRERE